MVLAYYLDVAPGATVVLTAASVFLVALVGTSSVRRLRADRARRGAARLDPAQITDLYE